MLAMRARDYHWGSSLWWTDSSRKHKCSQREMAYVCISESTRNVYSDLLFLPESVVSIAQMDYSQHCVTTQAASRYIMVLTT